MELRQAISKSGESSQRDVFCDCSECQVDGPDGRGRWISKTLQDFHIKQWALQSTQISQRGRGAVADRLVTTSRAQALAGRGRGTKLLGGSQKHSNTRGGTASKCVPCILTLLTSCTITRLQRPHPYNINSELRAVAPNVQDHLLPNQPESPVPGRSLSPMTIDTSIESPLNIQFRTPSPIPDEHLHDSIEIQQAINELESGSPRTQLLSHNSAHSMSTSHSPSHSPSVRATQGTEDLTQSSKGKSEVLLATIQTRMKSS
jgi:hypothetical protein